MSTHEWKEDDWDGEPSAEMSVDWIEDDLERTPIAEITILDEADILPALAKARATG